MHNQISVEKAIENGKLTIIYPILSLFLGSPIISILALKPFENQIIDGLWFPIALWIGIIVGFILMKLYWDIASSKWQLSAFENVSHVHELKMKAIQKKLMTEKNFILSKKLRTTNFETQKIVNRIKERFEQKDTYHDTFDVPNETIIKATLLGNLFFLAFSLLFFGSGLYAIITFENFSYKYLIPLILGGCFTYISIKVFLDKEPSVIINSRGIKLAKKNLMEWENITSEHVEERNNGNYISHHLIFVYKNKEENLVLGNLDKKPKEVEQLIRVYRVRFEKNTIS